MQLHFVVLRQGLTFVEIVEGFTNSKEAHERVEHYLKNPRLTKSELLGQYGVESVNVEVNGVRLRPSVEKFAQAMEEKLRKHDADRGPSGWSGDGVERLFDRLSDESNELFDAIYVDDSADEVMSEATDVGNFAMMIFDEAEKTK